MTGIYSKAYTEESDPFKFVLYHRSAAGGGWAEGAGEAASSRIGVAR